MPGDPSFRCPMRRGPRVQQAARLRALEQGHLLSHRRHWHTDSGGPSIPLSPWAAVSLYAHS